MGMGYFAAEKQHNCNQMEHSGRAKGLYKSRFKINGVQSTSCRVWQLSRIVAPLLLLMYLFLNKRLEECKKANI